MARDRYLDLQALEEPITRILTAPGTDLTTISAKRVRKTLLQDAQYAYLGLTTEVLKTRREEVDEVIGRVYKRVSQEAGAEGSSSNGNGEGKRKREADEEGEDVGVEGDGDGDAEAEVEVEDGSSVSKPPKKKGKKSVEESDAVLARKLSTEINSRSRRGASAAGSTSPRKAGKRKPKKSAEMVDSAEEDEDGEGESKRKKRSGGGARGGFGKEFILSAPLSAVLAVEKLSRPQVVKKLWEYIRQHDLQNPSNKREILCDNALRAVFSVDKIDMFRMNKVLGQHLHEG